jgi:hypothetical protein
MMLFLVVFINNSSASGDSTKVLNKGKSLADTDFAVLLILPLILSSALLVFADVALFNGLRGGRLGLGVLLMSLLLAVVSAIGLPNCASTNFYFKLYSIMEPVTSSL